MSIMMMKIQKPKVDPLVEQEVVSSQDDNFFLLLVNFSEMDESTTSKPADFRCRCFHVMPPNEMRRNEKRKKKKKEKK